MNKIENLINDKEAISNWEDEGGALKPIFVSEKKDNKIMICVGILACLPLIYWLTRKM